MDSHGGGHYLDRSGSKHESNFVCFGYSVVDSSGALTKLPACRLMERPTCMFFKEHVLRQIATWTVASCLTEADWRQQIEDPTSHRYMERVEYKLLFRFKEQG
jgi:hypothetical protein